MLDIRVTAELIRKKFSIYFEGISTIYTCYVVPYPCCLVFV